MPYVDGFVVPMAKRNVPAYRKMARKAGKVWIEYGALEVHECVADDLNVPMGVSFSKLLKLKQGETIFFSWITYKSRTHRDRVNKLVMKDPRITKMGPEEMPFDIKRMVYGGFKSVVDLE
ncbi:MAG: DUF1428 domain-containing protein [Gemmatimonadota bacterium]